MKKRTKKHNAEPQIQDKKQEDDYPVFCFKYLQDVSIKDCKNYKIYRDFLFRLVKLAKLGWKEIGVSDKHSFGIEPLPLDRFKNSLPSIVTPEMKSLSVFRANGNNLPFVGVRFKNVFHIIFIETQFGDIYEH